MLRRAVQLFATAVDHLVDIGCVRLDFMRCGGPPVVHGISILVAGPSCCFQLCLAPLGVFYFQYSVCGCAMVAVVPEDVFSWIEVVLGTICWLSSLCESTRCLWFCVRVRSIGPSRARNRGDGGIRPALLGLTGNVCLFERFTTAALLLTLCRTVFTTSSWMLFNSLYPESRQILRANVDVRS